MKGDEGQERNIILRIRPRFFATTVSSMPSCRYVADAILRVVDAGLYGV
jgi:hypothetical protein